MYFPPSHLPHDHRCARQEKEQALQMWRITTEELEQLNELYQEHVGDAQLHLQERQHYKVPPLAVWELATEPPAAAATVINFLKSSLHFSCNI